MDKVFYQVIYSDKGEVNIETYLNWADVQEVVDQFYDKDESTITVIKIKDLEKFSLRIDDNEVEVMKEGAEIIEFEFEHGKGFVPTTEVK